MYWFTISKVPALTALDPRGFTTAESAHEDAIFEEFSDWQVLPANEAWRDAARQALDRALLIGLLGLPEDVLEPLGSSGFYGGFGDGNFQGCSSSETTIGDRVVRSSTAKPI